MLPALCIALATRLATDGALRVNGVLPAALAADVRTVALAAAVPGAQRQEVPLSLTSDARKTHERLTSRKESEKANAFAKAVVVGEIQKSFMPDLTDFATNLKAREEGAT